MKKFTIRERTAAETINAVSVLNLITGIINPPQEKPLNVKLDMEILGTKIVRIYKRIAFVIKENNPRVIIFRGRENMFKTGFRIMFNIVKINPETIIAWNPPEIFTPIIT